MKLPVLMYHDITRDGQPCALTIRLNQLEQQFQFIKQEGYQTISLRQFYNYLTIGEKLPDKPLLISFDDGYKSNFIHLYPLLARYQIKAAIFLVAGFVKSKENSATDKYLHLDDLKQMDTALVDFGLHSFNHKSYTDLSIEEIDSDLKMMQNRFSDLSITVVPLFAYPFGAFPKKDQIKMKQLKQLFHLYQIAGAFRIGNRINSLPKTKAFNIQRIDVKGTDSFWKFKIMLRIGKKWLL